MQKVNLDLIPGGVAPIVYASQYDDGRVIRFMLTSGGSDIYILSASEVITCNLTKPDGTETVIDVANPGAGKNYVDLVNGADDYDQEGVYSGEIVLTRNSTVQGTANFILKVEADAYDGQVTTDTANGNPCTFDTDLADNLVSLTAEIVAKQDLHGYDRPWPAGGGKNKFDYTQATGGTFDNNNGTFTNNATDTRTTFYLTIQAYNGSTLVSTIGSKTISSTGVAFCTFTFPSGANILRIKHNGSQTDLVIFYPFTTEGEFTLSFNVLGYNPSVVGGLSFKNVQIEAGNTATDYAPYSNVCPINGYTEANITRCGVNIWDEEWEYINSRVTSKNYIPVVPDTVYYFGNVKLYDVEMFDTSKNSLGNPTYTGVAGGFLFTTASNCSFIKFSVANSYGATYLNDISINYPSTDHDYHAYNGQTYTIAFGQTVYGGVLDVTRGKLSVTHNYFKGGFTQYNASNGYKAYYRGGLPKSKSTISGGLSNMVSEFGGFDSSNMTKNIILLPDNSGTCYMALDENAHPADVEIAYERDVIFDIDLTPVQISALVGTNNITSDLGGDVEVTYIKKV